VTQDDLSVAAAAIVEAEAAGRYLDELMDAVACCFFRVEPRLQARKYVRALMSDLPRKNCWAIAEHAGDASPDRMQRLLERARWDTMAAMGKVRRFATGHLVSERAVAVLDESGQEKKGTATVGVKRQYLGCAGRVSNAINIVYCSYATPSGHALVGTRPYLPAEWAADPDRRDAADGVLPPWVTGDEVYGRDPRLRAWLEDHATGYVLGIPKSMRIAFAPGVKERADAVLKTLTKGDWTIDSCGNGSKGDRRYAWAWAATASPRHHLLIRRNLTPNTKGEHELAFFWCFVPEDRPATLKALIRIAGMRWPVEEDFQVGKDAFGLDHSQVRTYPALLRHLVLAMAALAVCALTSATAKGRTTAPPAGPTGPDEAPPADPGLIPLTVAEVKRLFNLLTRTWQPIRHHLNWSTWRRRHQARARRFHQRTRLRRAPT
jgi:SRSO17 transposase